ncbi:MAG TPA: TIM barrel protein [Arsenicitalea sp.]|jgi:hydroxypyruvate isomerase|nr:TIM barrel protein [Arsenicitalea sp.]
MRFSACIELLFKPEHPDFSDRIHAAKAAGFDAVEFWRWSNKDMEAVAAALQQTGLPLAGILCEPIANLTDPAAHAGFLDGVRQSLAAAQRLGTGLMIAQAGNALPGVQRAEQHAAIVACLRQAAEILEGSGVIIALEPLNDRVDHPGYFLTSTVEGLDIIDEVGRPEIRLLYDIYHAAVMGEAIDVLTGRLDSVAHVHLADTPGRHEPGSGTMDWQARLGWLRGAGYRGLVGLEYSPSGPTMESLRFVETVPRG